MLSTRRTTGVAAAILFCLACRDAQTEKEVTTRTSGGEASLSMSGDSADKRGVALVRVVNAVPGASTVYVRADSAHALGPAAYKKVTSYTDIDRNWVNFQVSTSQRGSYEPLTTNREMLTDGYRYTIVVMKNDDGVWETRVLRDEISADNANAQIRVIHAARGIDEVNVVERAGDTLFNGVNFTTEAGYKTLAPWSGTLEIRSEDGNRLLATIPNVALNAGHSYTFVLTRNTAGKIEVIRFDDAQVN